MNIGMMKQQWNEKNVVLKINILLHYPNIDRFISKDFWFVSMLTVSNDSDATFTHIKTVVRFKLFQKWTKNAVYTNPNIWGADNSVRTNIVYIFGKYSNGSSWYNRCPVSWTFR